MSKINPPPAGNEGAAPSAEGPLVRTDDRHDDVPAPMTWSSTRRRADLAHLRELVVHLTRRELAATHRGTLLGAAWPLVRQLTQLAVLVFVFSKVIDLGIADYPAFVFSGLIAWSWFSSGMSNAARSVLASRHLIFQPGFPAIVVPVVAVAVPVVDALVALPVLGAMLIVNDDVHVSALALPALLLVQLLLMVGLAWLTAALSVYLRDVPNAVGLVLLLLFYVTPIYFSLGKVPEDYQGLLRLNPVATLLEAYRAVLLGDPFPDLANFAGVVVFSVAAAVAGYAVFRRLTPGFVEEL